ncbi:hypothetical protein [Rasiella sp. SM2506]|uniref:hypothetical protein n=1 Tax=Rasiella sp. SM2506 TaxID=3423914 RepID=UPI003D7BFDE4
MKKITLWVACLLFICTIKAQETLLENDPIPNAEVPELVRKSQEANFPSSYVRAWSIDRGVTAGDDKPVSYRATFSDTGGTNSEYATYLPNGMLFFHSQFLESNTIPSNIILQTRSEFDMYEIEHADFITMYNPKREIYRVKVRDQALVQMVYYTVDGIKIPKQDLPEELLVFKY